MAKKITLVILIICLIIYAFFAFKEYKTNSALNENIMESNGNQEVETVSKDVSLFGNGFYVCKLKNQPEIEINCFISMSNDIFLCDAESRIYKYYFEAWEYNEKDKFIVTEEYENYTYKSTTNNDYFLNYQTCIEVNNYDEMIEATNNIIDFLQYMEIDIIIKSYIKFEDELILPHNVSDQDSEKILESAITQYWNIVNK